MKILAASIDPEFVTKIKTSPASVEIVETGENLLELLTNDDYAGLITDASIHDVDVWQLVRLIRSGRWCDMGLPIIIIDDRSEKISSLLAANYDVKIMPLAEVCDLHEELKKTNAKPSILVIEDDRDAANGAYHALKNDYQVDLAVNGKEGLEFFKKKRHNLVLLDLMLPDLFGEVILKKIHKINPRQAVIISTARTESNMHKKLMFSGASEYLTKPYGLEELRKSCRIVYTQSMLNQEIDIREKTIDDIASKISLIDDFMGQEKHEEARHALGLLLSIMPERLPGDDLLI